MEKIQITQTLTPDQERLDFLPKHLGTQCVHVETLIYAIMDKASDDYNGGFWNFFELSNGGFFIVPDRTEAMKIEWPDSYFSGSLSPEAAGIGATLITLSNLSFNDARMAEKFHQLRDFALDHPEGGQIFGFID